MMALWMMASDWVANTPFGATLFQGPFWEWGVWECRSYLGHSWQLKRDHTMNLHVHMLLPLIGQSLFLSCCLSLWWQIYMLFLACSFTGRPTLPELLRFTCADEKKFNIAKQIGDEYKTLCSMMTIGRKLQAWKANINLTPLKSTCKFLRNG